MTEKGQQGEKYMTGDQLTTEASDLLASFLLTGGLLRPAGMKHVGQRKEQRLGGKPAAVSLWENSQRSSASRPLLLQELLFSPGHARPQGEGFWPHERKTKSISLSAPLGPTGEAV